MQVVIAGADHGRALTAAVRASRELASAHIVVCAALDSPDELRAALDAGADDVMRVPFEPEVLVARVAAGLRAARLRENEALLRSLVANIPGAVYRCACDEHWTMQWLSDEIEEISGYPASEFIDSAVRTFASVIHPDDREQVERSVMDAVDAGRPFTLEYRIVRRDGGERWVLERGQAQDAGTAGAGSTARSSTSPRAAPPSRRCASARSSRRSWPRSAPRAHASSRPPTAPGARSSATSTTARSSGSCPSRCSCRSGCGRTGLGEDSRAELAEVLAELRAGLAELRDLAHGLHPAVLSDRGLGHALSSLAYRAAVPVELELALPAARLPIAVEAAAYFTVCEALTNVAKYAHATRSWVTVDGATASS